MSPAFTTYFRDHLRSKSKLLICLVVFALVITLVYTVGGQKHEYTYRDYETDRMITNISYHSNLGIPLFFLSVCSCVIPVTEFSFFKKRRNLDCAYALPISRREMGIVHYVTGLICLIVPYTCSYVCNFLLLLRYPEGFIYEPLVGYFFLNLLVSIAVYSLFVFVFNQANSTGDGIWFIILWSFLLYLILSAYNSFSETVYDTFLMDENSETRYEKYRLWADKWQLDSSYGLPWGLQSQMNWIYGEVVEKAENRSLDELWRERDFVVFFVVWLLIGVASVFGFVLSFGKRKTEKTQEVSDSWFGYKVLIPLYAFLTNLGSGGLSILGVMIVTFVGYLIYRKGFHLKLWDWIMMGLILVGSIVLLIVLYVILGITLYI